MIANLINTENNRSDIEEMRKLEREMESVNEVFTNMAILIDNQGENIENIQTNLESSNNQINSGNEQLIKAKKYQNSTRKCMYRIACLICGILIFLILTIVLTSINQKRA